MVSARDLAARLLPPLGRLRAQRDAFAARADALGAERDQLAAELSDAEGWGGGPRLFPPGHFYSPIPDLDEVRRREDAIFGVPENISGIDLRIDEQLALVNSLKQTWAAWPYYGRQQRGTRYQPDNDYFGHVDALLLFGLLCSLRPKRYVEVGSGWSSALVLDTRDRVLDGLDATFIEPYPERLNSLLQVGDSAGTTILESPVQEVDPSPFEQLEPGDVLFIDSTHVSKVGSDVNHLFFDVLPRVAPGVWIHVHDIRYPFEYSPEWVYEGRAWNEAYLLRALLTETPAWSIEVWASCLQTLRAEKFRQLLPAQATIDGASIWLRHQ